jgi:trans-2,3-dihydro-3-hydroxyanthranilate isomerase
VKRSLYAAIVRLSYDVVDVFTDRPFAGNPLAVVYGADSLPTAAMHAIAREFNLSETTFPVPRTPDESPASADYSVRIFTPGGEVPFAGHPTLGTAWALRERGLLSPGERVQSCPAGLIGVRIAADPTDLVELSASPGDPARALSEHDAEELAGLVGVRPADLAGAAYAAGCGLTWLYLCVTEEAVASSRPSARPLSETGIDLSFLEDPVDGVDVYSLDSTDGEIAVHSRVYVPGFGIPEDSATGSAAAGLGLVLVASGVAAAEGETPYTISQGVEMDRPSRLLGRVEATAGAGTLVHVAGQVVPVATGSIAVPVVPAPQD